MTNPGKHAEKPLRVEVVVLQCNWIVRYPGSDGELGPRNYKLINSVNSLGVDFTSQTARDDLMPTEIVLPVGQPVKMVFGALDVIRSEEHTSELQSLMRISYAVFCLKKKKHQ